GKEIYQITTNPKLTPWVPWAYSSDGKTILVSSDDHTIRRWDAESGKEVGVFIKTPDVVRKMAITPDDRVLLTVSSKAQLWDLQTGKQIREFPFAASIGQNIDLSPDGNFLALWDFDGKGYLWDVKTGQEIRTFTGHNAGPIFDIAFSPDNKYMLTSAGDKTA